MKQDVDMQEAPDRHAFDQVFVGARTANAFVDVNEHFFPDGRLKANLLVNLGWMDPVGIRPRGPRLAFEDAVKIV